MFATPPTAAALFGTASTLALAGWGLLALAILFRWQRLRDWGAGLILPLILATLYTAIIGIHWWNAEGGFNSLADVSLLFRSDWLLLAGWVHFLAYDLFIGAWIARDAEARRLPRGLLIPVLPLAFLFGPAGLLLWLMLRTAFRPTLDGANAMTPVSSPWAILSAAYRGNPLLAGTGVFFLLCLVPTGLALLLDTRLFNGISVWIKPMKFQASLALHTLTLALLLNLLPEKPRTGRWIAALAVATVAASLFEMLYIAWQAAQGQASHYSVSTPFTAAMYSLMGGGAVLLVALTAALGMAILRIGTGPRVLVIGAGLGLILGGVLGGISGIWMGGQPGHWVGGIASDAGGLPIVNWSRTGGDLRVAHFFGLHLMQALPLLALLLWGLKTRPWRLALYGGAVFGTLLTVATFVQAIGGRPFL